MKRRQIVAHHIFRLNSTHSNVLEQTNERTRIFICLENLPLSVHMHPSIMSYQQHSHNKYVHINQKHAKDVILLIPFRLKLHYLPWLSSHSNKIGLC